MAAALGYDWEAGPRVFSREEVGSLLSGGGRESFLGRRFGPVVARPGVFSLLPRA